MSRSQIQQARRVSAAEFTAMLDTSADREARAAEMIERARNRAEQIVTEAKEAAQRQHRKLTDLGDEELRQFIDKDRIDQHAAEVVSVLQTVAEIRDSHAALAPWIITLVETCLDRLLGELTPRERLAGAVRSGLANLDRSYRILLRAAPGCHAELCAALEAAPDLARAVEDTVADPALSGEAIVLECSAGSIELTLDTQREALIDALRATLDTVTEDSQTPEPDAEEPTDTTQEVEL